MLLYSDKNVNSPNYSHIFEGLNNASKTLRDEAIMDSSYYTPEGQTKLKNDLCLITQLSIK